MKLPSPYPNAGLFDALMFEEDLPSRLAALAKICWSYSRRGLFEACLRHYFFQHYGTLKRTVFDAKLKAELLPLKLLRNRHLRAGELLHRAVANHFRELATGGRGDGAAQRKLARNAFDRDIKHSQGLSPSTTGGVVGKLCTLQEFTQGLPDAEKLCRDTETRMDEALRQFLSNPVYERFHAAARTGTAVIERHFWLKGLPCNVQGQIDFAWNDGGRVTIVDWKLNEAERETDDSLQLATYALWAQKEFNCRPEDIVVFKAYLSKGSLVPFEADARTLARARTRILQDAERMASMHSYGRAGNVAAFTPSVQLGLCRLCPFLAACVEGKECVYGSRN